MSFSNPEIYLTEAEFAGRYHLGRRTVRIGDQGVALVVAGNHAHGFCAGTKQSDDGPRRVLAVDQPAIRRVAALDAADHVADRPELPLVALAERRLHPLFETPASEIDEAAIARSAFSVRAYRNLDDLAEFRGRNTTTEFLAGEIHRRLARRIKEGALGSQAIGSLKVVLRETPVAWASYDAPLG